MNTIREKYSKSEVRKAFTKFASDMPVIMGQPTESKLRFSYHLLDKFFEPGCTVVDLGGGLNEFNGVFVSLGGHVKVFDIFEYDLAWYRETTLDKFKKDCERKREYLEAVGVQFHHIDISTCDLRDSYPKNSVDVITSYHCLEHLHQSPRFVLESAIDVLRPGGLLLVEVPNAVNILKRLKVLAGYTNYEPFSDYFDASNFTGHIREYSVGDLTALARRLKMETFNIYGRNWYGTLYDKFGDNFFSRSLDKILQLRPGLCGSLFLEYRKPAVA
jgi:SAM-dependent methyltransferase